MDNVKIFFHIWSEVNCDEVIQDIYSYIPEELKFVVIECRNTREIHTYDRMYEICKQEDFKCGYLHTNGAYNRNECIDELRRYMCHFNLKLYKNCLSALDTYDCCGVDYRTEPQPHFSGNFWWANSTYLRTLCEPALTRTTLTERHKCEFWCCSSPHKQLSFFDSGVNVYERHLYKYPKENYLGKIDE